MVSADSGPVHKELVAQAANCHEQQISSLVRDLQEVSVSLERILGAISKWIQQLTAVSPVPVPALVVSNTEPHLLLHELLIQRAGNMQAIPTYRQKDYEEPLIGRGSLPSA